MDFEVIFQIFKFLFLIPTVLLLIYLLSTVVTTNPSIESSFNDVCSSGIEKYLFSGYSVDSKSVFFQFIFPEDTLNEKFNLILEYNDKSFKIIESLYDSSTTLKSVITTVTGEKVTRQNFGFLKRCSDEACLCLADTGITNFNFSYLSRSACFSLLYANETAMTIFDGSVKKSTLLTDVAIFDEAVAIVRASPTTLKLIKNCYDYIDNLDLSIEQLNKGEFLLNETTPNSNNELGTYLNNFYLKTQASLLYNIWDCSPIPNTKNCIHPSDIRSNFLVLKDLGNDYIFEYESGAISAGGSSGCRVFNTINNTICWGNNIYGILGTSAKYKYSPLDLIENNNFKSISVSRVHACAINSTGSGFCWGSNKFGQLGFEVSELKYIIPTYVSIIKETVHQHHGPPSYKFHNFTSISAGYFHSCGIFENSKAICWGSNEYGQLGNGSIGGILIKYNTIENYIFLDISAGGYFTCGVLNNGSAVCWGINTNGQLGNEDSVNSGVPVFVKGNYNFSSISAGEMHICGILNNGSAVCWGNNYYKELGNGGTEITINFPVFVKGNYNFSSISAGVKHTCGILTNGSAVCWGNNNYGQLGHGLIKDSFIPVFVKGNYNFSSISAGADFTCGILKNGKSVCWGINTKGQLGDGLVQDSLIPVYVKEPVVENIFSVFLRADFNVFFAFNPNSTKTGLKATVSKQENILLIEPIDD
jgi:alpha-tubulin suppressor-like RCC1 family protein